MKKVFSIAAVFLVAVSTFTILTYNVKATSLQFQLEPLIVSPTADSGSHILQDSTGKVWVFFCSIGRVDTPSYNRHIFYIISLDGGITWSDPSLFLPAYVPGLTVQHPVAFQDSTGRIWVAWTNHTAPYNADQVWFTTSYDGENWIPAKQLCDGHNDMPGGFVETQGKVWFFTSPMATNWRISYKTTEDGGGSWSSFVTITDEEGLRTPHPTVLGNGTIFVVYRIGMSHYYANIGYSASSDGGLTWRNGVVDDPAYPEWDGYPRIVEHHESVYVFFDRVHEQEGYTRDVWLRVWNKTKWEIPQQMTNDIQNTAYPAPACVNKQLWVAFENYTELGADYDIWLAKTYQSITATVDIHPEALNLKSNGEWITCYIELPKGYDVNNINVSSILLNSTIPADSSAPTAIGDYDNDGIPDLMVKFDRAEVISYILDNIDIEERFTTVTLTIAGNLYDGTPFQGSDTIKIIYMMPRHERFVKLH